VIISKFNDVLLITGGGRGGAGGGRGFKSGSCLGTAVRRGGVYGVFVFVGFGCVGDVGVVVVVVVDVVFVALLFVVVDVRDFVILVVS
jgi:hypothetical protein